jgi:hypothetical protein
MPRKTLTIAEAYGKPSPAGLPPEPPELDEAKVIELEECAMAAWQLFLRILRNSPLDQLMPVYARLGRE